MQNRVQEWENRVQEGNSRVQEGNNRVQEGNNSRRAIVGQSRDGQLFRPGHVKLGEYCVSWSYPNSEPVAAAT